METSQLRKKIESFGAKMCQLFGRTVISVFCKKAMETLFSQKSNDQQLDITAGGKDEDDRKWWKDDSAACRFFLMTRMNRLLPM